MSELIEQAMSRLPGECIRGLEVKVLERGNLPWSAVRLTMFEEERPGSAGPDTSEGWEYQYEVTVPLEVLLDVLNKENTSSQH